MASDSVTANLADSTVSKFLAESTASQSLDSIPSPIVRIDILTAQLATLKQSIDHRCISLAKERNALAPINKLPTELIILIIGASMPKAGSIEWGRRVVELCSVQAWWRKQIISSSGFWTNLDQNNPPWLTEMNLERSQNATLDVRCADDADGLIDHFLSLAMPHAHRWRRLEYIIGSELDGRIKTYLESENPLLVELRMVAGSFEGYDPIRFGGAPQLRTLNFECVDLEDWRVLKNLTSLRISTPWSLPDFEDALLDVLDACPMLEDLMLLYVTSELAGGGIPTFSPVIQLPHLRTLSLKCLSSPTVQLLLRRIQADAVEWLEISHQRTVDDTPIAIEEGEEIIARLVEPRPAGLSHLSQILSRGEINDVSLQVRGEYLNVEAQGPGKGGRQTVINLKVAVSQESLLRMAPTLPFAPPSYHGDLRVIWKDTFNREHRQLPSVAHVPRIFPGTTHLEFDYYDQTCIEALQYLSKRDNSDQWPCTKLREISFPYKPVQGELSAIAVELAETIRQLRAVKLPAIPPYGKKLEDIELGASPSSIMISFRLTL